MANLAAPVHCSGDDDFEYNNLIIGVMMITVNLAAPVVMMILSMILIKYNNLVIGVMMMMANLASPMVPPVPVWIDPWTTSTVTASSLSSKS